MRRHATSTRTTELRRDRPGGGGERGAALVVVLLLLVMLSAVGTSVALLADIETIVASNHRDQIDVRHAADGGAEFVVQELARLADWTPVLSGAVGSAMAGPLVLPPPAGGSPLDAPALTAALQADTYGAAVWGADTPRWRLFAHGVPGVDLPFTGLSHRVYVLVWVSDDIAEVDGDPWTDTNGGVVVRARAFGTRGSQCDVQLVVSRVGPGIVRRVSSRVIR